MFSLIGAIIIGGIAGAIAKFIMPGRDGGGIILTIILGIVGALVATFLGQALGWYAPGQSTGFIGSIVGAIIVLFVFRLVSGRRTV